ncbi:unnamed protein product [Haemonchus placei]|uniref:Uncharacterized protein n=1 Tax=Haemonchus placei TaxID=6290 RepID=A0A0N4W343_HAEPC|nr:unnamed protein product [Haemonchus placei]
MNEEEEEEQEEGVPDNTIHMGAVNKRQTPFTSVSMIPSIKSFLAVTAIKPVPSLLFSFAFGMRAALPLIALPSTS